MKTKSIVTFLVLTVVFSASVFAQSTAKLIAVVNFADWCHVCEENGERAMSLFEKNNKDEDVLFITNNLTNSDTKSKSDKILDEYGLEDIMSEFKYTGVVFFFDNDSKKLITRISLVQPDNELAKAMSNARKSVL